jgi:hypothetical protein
MTEWFRRLADVPDVGYTADPRVKRGRLPGHDTVPTISLHTFEGEPREYLSWPMPNGSTIQSPAGSYSATHLQDSAKSAEMLLQRLHETLELPGTVSDYHFAIQRCVEELWRHRQREPTVLQEVERLCWLDIRLIEARPETIVSPKKGDPTYFQILAFGHLVDLYSGEGFLREALEVAERGIRLHQKTPMAELRERLARMDTEEP